MPSQKISKNADEENYKSCDCGRSIICILDPVENKKPAEEINNQPDPKKKAGNKFNMICFWAGDFAGLEFNVRSLSSQIKKLVIEINMIAAAAPQVLLASKNALTTVTIVLTVARAPAHLARIHQYDGGSSVFIRSEILGDRNHNNLR